MSRDDPHRWENRANLMRRAQAGDRDAYRTLLDDITPILARFLRRWAPDADDLDDLCQDTLMTLHRVRHTYDPTRPLDPWLFAIARNVAAEHLRRRLTRLSRELPVETLPDVPSPDDAVADLGLENALARLPANQRQAFELLKFQGLSVAESARRAGSSQGALKVRAHRAYRAIKEMLKG
jgi:RNA polymerase sigma-70 factor (ECF subfamily)